MVTNPDTNAYGANQSAQQDQVVNDMLANLEIHARGMWRYRWRAVVVMWIVSLAGWFAVYSMPPVYEANARIYVDTENAIRPLLVGIAASSNVMNEVTVVTRELLSRPNLAEVARTTDLDLRAETDAEFEELLSALQNRIQVSGNRDNIFSIAYRDPNRQKAVAVVDALVNAFVENSLGADRTEASKAQQFLRDQIGDFEARLTAAENRRAKFKRDNVALMPGQQGGYFARLQSGRLELGQTQVKLRLAEERRSELLRQLQGEEPVFGIMSAPQAGSGGGGGFAAGKIRQLESQLEELRLQYTDKHPRIGQILDTIELLKAQQAEENAAAGTGGSSRTLGPSPLDMNPVYQNMRIQLTNAEVEIASLRAELNQQQQNIEELRTLVDTVPQVEAELGRLDRDYDVVKTKYEQLLVQLETANIGEDVEASIDEVQFRIIDPPFAGRNPAGPQRQLFLIVVLLGSLGVGAALLFVLNLLNPVFFSSRAVKSGVGIPVLGSVSLILSSEEVSEKRKSHLHFAVAVGMLVVLFGFLSMFADQLSPVLRRITGVI